VFHGNVIPSRTDGDGGEGAGKSPKAVFTPRLSINSAPTVLPRRLIKFAVSGEMSFGQFRTISRQVNISSFGHASPSQWMSCLGASSSGDGVAEVAVIRSGIVIASSSELELDELELLGSWRPSPPLFSSRFINLEERSSSLSNYCGLFYLQASVKPCAPALELEVRDVSLASLVVNSSCLTYKAI
jgi:hypothetical protein